MQRTIEHHTRESDPVPLIKSPGSIRLPYSAEDVAHSTGVEAGGGAGVHGEAGAEEFDGVEDGGGGSAGEPAGEEGGDEGASSFALVVGAVGGEVEGEVHYGGDGDFVLVHEHEV